MIQGGADDYLRRLFNRSDIRLRCYRFLGDEMKATYLALALICPSAFAAYTTMTLEGVQQANGVWTAAGVMDTQGFVRTTGAVTVAGTVRNLPVTSTVDVPAASRLLKLGSKAIGPIALAATAYDVYQWATSTDIDSSGDSWVLGTESSSDPGFIYGTEWFATVGGQQQVASSPLTICKAHNTWLKTQNMYGWSTNIRLTPTSNTYKCETLSANSSFIVGTISISSRGCTSTDIPSCNPPAPVSDTTFLNLPDPSLPILSSGWSKLPSLQGQPIPIKSVDFTPYSEWYGEPYFKNGNWYRDRMDVSPAPTTSQPTRVRVDIGPVKIEGATNPEQVPNTGTAGGSTPKEQPDFCEANPASIACQEMGQLEEEPLENDEVQFNLDTNQSWGSSNASCPANPTITIHSGQTITFNYKPACDFFSLLRPIIIAFSLLTAVFIAIGRTE